MIRLVECTTRADFTLRVRFDDGLQGEIFLGNLVDLDALRAWREPWRDLAVFMAVQLDAGDVVWPRAGVRLAGEILWEEVAGHPAFQRFMARVLDRPRCEGRS